MSKHCLPSVNPMEKCVWGGMMWARQIIGKKSDGEYVRLRQHAVCLKQLKLTTVPKSSHRQYVSLQTGKAIFQEVYLQNR